MTFADPVGRTRAGALAADGRIVDLNSACGLYLRDVENEGAHNRLAGALVPSDMRKLFAGGDTSLETARKAFDHVLGNDSQYGPAGEPIFFAEEEIILKAPIIPRKFFHVAGNFRETVSAMPWIVNFKNVDAIIGHEEPVIYPEHFTQELDCEVELGVVLKKSGKHFATADATDYIGGYVICNTITARDIQRREMKSGVSSFATGIDTFCPLGPWIVTADEIPNPHNLAMALRVNGKPLQSSQSGKMSVRLPEILSRYSAMGYTPGDIVSIGAFEGVPKASYLKIGDVMECEIENIGILQNRVISWEEAYGRKPPARAT